MKFIAMSVIGIGALVSAASAIPAVPRGDATAGRAAFAQCAGCHSLVPNETRVGPSLAGVVGRPIASAAGYAYSAALRAGRSRTWSAVSLEAFLADPNKVFPGNKMGVGVASPKTRADIVAYLATNPGR